MAIRDAKLGGDRSDLLHLKTELERSDRRLKETYDEFLASFAQFRATESQFRGKSAREGDAPPKARFRT